MEGFIKLHRKILDWQWYDDINTKVVFLHLLLTANYEDKSWHGIQIKRGQLIISLSNLAEETCLTLKQVRLALDKLKRTNEIVTKGHTRYTLVTIVNYEKYQINEKVEGKQRAYNRANRGQTKGNNIRNKEYKEERNIYLISNEKDLENIYEN